MNQHTHAGILYIACRLITGKRPASVIDIGHSRKIDLEVLLADGLLREFDEQQRDYIPGYARECSYRFDGSNGFTIELFINWRTFIAHVCGSSAYFIGNIQGDTVYLYDHKGASHYRYRILDYVSEREKIA